MFCRASIHYCMPYPQTPRNSALQTVLAESEETIFIFYPTTWNTGWDEQLILVNPPTDCNDLYCFQTMNSPIIFLAGIWNWEPRNYEALKWELQLWNNGIQLELENPLVVCVKNSHERVKSRMVQIKREVEMAWLRLSGYSWELPPFFLCLVFCSLNMIWLHVGFFFLFLIFILFGVLSASWICGLGSVINFQLLLLDIFLLFLVFQWLARFIFWNCPTVVECFFHSFSILHFILWSFWWPISSSLVFFSWLCWVYCWPIKGILHFCFCMLYIFSKESLLY